MRRNIFLWPLLATNLMPRCGEAFSFGFFLLRTFCRDAAKHFPFDSSCYQPFAAMRRSIFLWPLLATNLLPLCGEAFSFGLFLLRTFCRDAAKHFEIASS
jgi:hypothetical protein